MSSSGQDEGFFEFPTASPDTGEPEDERSMTFGMFGVLLFLDACFISVYYITRDLRRCTDAETETLPQKKDFGAEANVKQPSGFAAGVEKIFFGFLMGKIKPMPLSIQIFPGWRRIKYRAHMYLSGFVILISLALLNPSMLVPDGTDVGGLTLKGEMCKPFDRQAGLDALRAEVLEITNYTIAVRQWSHMWYFHQALLNDTSRYGVNDALGDHTCTTIKANGAVREVPGNKDKWVDITTYPAAEFGAFFPGYCASSREHASLSALSAKCVDEKCGCPRLPTNGLTQFFGIANKEICLLRLCLTSPIACPAHTNDAEINPDSFSEAQLSVTDTGEPSVEPRVKLSDEVKDATRTGIMLLLYQVDVASNLYAIYSIVAIFFPSPMKVFRLPRWIAIKRFLFGAEQLQFIIIFVSSIWIYKYLSEYLSDPDFTIIMSNFLRGDPCYLDGKYVFDRYKVIDEICDKMVPLEPNFNFKYKTIPSILTEIGFFAKASCNNCFFPMHYLFEFRTEKFPLTEVGELGFNVPSPEHMCKRRIPSTCQVLLPKENITFLGNRTICLDSEFAKSRALVAPETELTVNAVSKMWINSGLLASFLVKIAMINYAMGLLHMADPFISCDGKFLWIPEQLGSGLGKRDKNEVFRGFTKNKLKTLRNSHFRTCIIWGTIFHLCVYNLLKSAFTTSAQLYGGLMIGSQDRAILSITGVGTALLVFITLCWRSILKKKINAFKGL